MSSTMTAADWAALSQAGAEGGTAYLEALYAQSQQAAGVAAAGNAAPATSSAATTPPVGSAMTTDANGNPVTDQDAVAILSQELTSWGFGQDAIDWAKAQITSNNSIDQIVYSLRQQPFYVNSVFGQVAAARASAGLPAMTEAQILSYQDYATGVAQQAGLPPGFINTDELVKLMGADVSTTELDSRITTAYTDYAKSDPLTQQTLQQDFGVTPGDAAAYFLDPTKALPVLQNQFAAAQVGAEAQRTGYGPISTPEQMQLAQQGVTDATAQTGFEDLAKQKQLFSALPGTSENNITQAVQLGAEFDHNAADAQTIAQRAQQREAVFQGNYHFAETQNRGITGLGSTPRNG